MNRTARALPLLLLLAGCAGTIDGSGGDDTVSADSNGGHLGAATSLGKCIDVARSSSADSTPVRLWSCNGTDAQSWRVTERGELRNAVANKCLDVQHSGTTQGTPVQEFHCNGTAAQTFTFDGVSLQGASGKCLDVPRSNWSAGQQVQLWGCNRTGAQSFDYHPSDGTFHGASGLCLTVRNGAAGQGTPIVVDSCQNPVPPEQRFLPGRGGFVSALSSASQMLCLDVDRDGGGDGNKIQIWGCNDSHAQRWAMVGAIHGIGGNCIDIDHSHTDDGTKIQMWGCNGADNQRWTLWSSTAVPMAAGGRVGGCPSRVGGNGNATATAVDLDVRYIERLPRRDFDAQPSAPQPGQKVTFLAHIGNSGAGGSFGAQYTFYLDGSPISGGTLGYVGGGQETTVSADWVFEAGRHWIQLRVYGVEDQITEDNDCLENATDGLAVGFWVEQSLHDWFDRNQVLLGKGATSWEDWAQRQIETWNGILAQSSYAETGAIYDRVRLDKVVVAPDDTLKLNVGVPTNYPSKDKTVDLMWGFPVHNDQGVAAWDDGYGSGGVPKLGADSPFDAEYTMLHELSHARYLVDDYSWNLNPHPGMDDVKVRRRDGSPVLAAGQRLFWRCRGGMMECEAPPGREHFYDILDVYAWNRIAGQRARCGNQNSPCNFGEYLLDTPVDHRIRVLRGPNQPVAGAQVTVWRSAFDQDQHLDVYDKVIDDIPDMSCVTDGSGTCSIGAHPFGVDTSGFNGSFQGVLLVRATAGGGEGFRFVYLPDAVIAHVQGKTEVTFDLTDSSL